MAKLGLKCIRRKEGKYGYYFIVNWGENAVDEWVSLRSKAESVALFNPMSGESGMVAHRKTDSGFAEVYLQLDFKNI